jgi:hypothetical protein
MMASFLRTILLLYTDPPTSLLQSVATTSDTTVAAGLSTVRGTMATTEAASAMVLVLPQDIAHLFQATVVIVTIKASMVESIKAIRPTAHSHFHNTLMAMATTSLRASPAVSTQAIQTLTSLRATMPTTSLRTVQAHSRRAIQLQTLRLLSPDRL